MSETTFRFRQFTIHQDKCAMKVGTDSVLLGSWVNPTYSSDILDIGTGSGIIALMLAQKSFAQIDAIDVDEDACNQARENFETSPWVDRLHVIHQPVQEYSKHSLKKYDLIVSNPPYFQDAYKPSEESRLKARHGDLLCFAELVEGVKKLLAEKGRFCLILPYREGNEFIGIALRKGLYCHEIVRVKTKADKIEKRLMMSFTFNFGMMTETELIIQDNDTNFSKEYVELTKDYYLGLEHRH
jgi:tRNA1Val (adenine37-N6)-methyltransferase